MMGLLLPFKTRLLAALADRISDPRNELANRIFMYFGPSWIDLLMAGGVLSEPGPIWIPDARRENHAVIHDVVGVRNCD